MTFGYFAPAPAAMPVGLPVFGKRQKTSGKRAETAATETGKSKKAA